MYLFFSDLDGTLLDHDTYSYEPAREGIALLRERHIPLILVSSKTYVEMKNLHEELKLDTPFIFENGGGIYWPFNGGAVEYRGVNVNELKQKKNLLEEALEEPVRFITDMDVDDIVQITGLSYKRAQWAQQRMASLPFIIQSGKQFKIHELEQISNRLNVHNLSITKGGRFYHLLSKQVNKASAMHSVINYYKKSLNEEVKIIAIGDSENDMSMLREADIPILVRKKNRTTCSSTIQNINITMGVGPYGFTEAVKCFIGKI